MRSWDALPDVSLKPGGALTAEFVARRITDYRAVERYLQALPYGRTTNRADFRAVLREGKGTCSTKHALLAALAREHRLPVTLMLGIYEMHERNTPGTGVILAQYGLRLIPEAHCYLSYRGTRIDITRSGAQPSEPIETFLYEEAIDPDQIGAYKIERHQRFLKQWLATTNETGMRSWEEIWHIREECIAALSGNV
jgi:hypothetical protein